MPKADKLKSKLKNFNSDIKSEDELQSSDDSPFDIQTSVTASEIDSLNDEISNLKEQNVRLLASIENSKRISTREIEKAHKYALGNFVKSILDVGDSIGSGIETASCNDCEASVVLDGLKMTKNIFETTLRTFGVEEINPVGLVFNPDYHEAVTMVASNDCDSNIIIEVVQIGYSLNGRLVRPSMVVVSS